MKELFVRPTAHKCSGICLTSEICDIQAPIEYIEKRKPDYEDIFVNTFLHRYAKFDTFDSTFVKPDINEVEVTDKFIFNNNKVLYFTYLVKWDGRYIKKTFIKYREGKHE